MFLNIALAGNQNCGKTTLFNLLTGSRRKVGNWPGVTVEKITGPVRPDWLPPDAASVQVVDLPGVYSLSAFSPEEDVTCRYLHSEPPDVIINVVDAVHLERNLYLTLQLLMLGVPVVIALNMMDELRTRGGELDSGLLESLLGTAVVPVCARSGEGIPALMKRAVEAHRERRIPPACFRCLGEAERTLRELLGLLRQEPAAATGSVQPLYRRAVMLMEESRYTPEATEQPEGPDGEILQKTAQAFRRLEARTGLSPSAALASGRYRYLEQLAERCLKQKPQPPKVRRLDGLLLSSPWSLLVLTVVLTGLFFLPFGFPGRFFTETFTGLLEAWAGLLLKGLTAAGVSSGLVQLMDDVFFRGVFSVLSFLPSLLILLFLLDLLEDSGYLARAAVLMDRPLRRVGLDGRSLIPLITGFGCTVPAAISARGLKGERQRILTILLTPLMSCSAKIPVYVMIAGAFFPARQPVVLGSLYLLGILLAALLGSLLGKSAGDASDEPFLVEMPDYHAPSLSNALGNALRKCKEFALRTFSVILFASLTIWLLNGYTFALRPAAAPQSSMLGVISGWLAPLLRPCGFGTGEAVAALLTGLLAKESIVSTLAVLAGGQTGISGLQAVFPNALSAFSFLVFVLLYPPCAAAMSAIRREVNRLSLVAAAFAGQLLLAWTVSMLIYQLGSLVGYG